VTGIVSQKSPNIHDAFFKHALGNAKAAGTFLREHLPAELVELLSTEPLQPEFTTFVDEHLRQHHSDLLFRLRLNTGDDTLAYVLFEHKSSPDPATTLQLLRYIVRILANWYDEHRRLPLPMVLPLVVHQGPKGWKSSTHFIDLFGNVPKSLHPYLLSFRHALVDLAKIKDHKLSADLRLSAYLKTMKYVQRPELPQRLESIFAPELSNTEMDPILRYIDNGPVPVSREIIQAALRKRLGHHRQEEIMGHFSKEYQAEFKAQGHAEGLAKGRAEGRAEGREGEAKLLIRLLEKRFGEVTSDLRQRIFASDIAVIEGWVERTLEARDLQSVFQSA
jgi:predicted transposase/invertase (TIGR01784 family)